MQQRPPQVQSAAEFIYQQGINANDLGFEILFHLAENKQWDKIKWLQARGFNINTADDHKIPLLNEIIRSSPVEDVREMISQLIPLGLDVNSFWLDTAGFPRTAINDALDNDKDEIVPVLLSHGAELNRNIPTSPSPFNTFLKKNNMSLEQNQKKALMMMKLGADVNGKMANGRYVIEGLPENAIEFLLSTNKVVFNPAMNLEAREAILIYLIKTEQWEKIKGLTSRNETKLTCLELPDDICDRILNLASTSNWPMEKVHTALEKLLELGANPGVGIYSQVVKQFKPNQWFELAKLVVKKGTLLSIETYPVEFLIWLCEQDLSERQNYYLLLAIKETILHNTLQGKENLDQLIVIAQKKWGANFVDETYSIDPVQRKRWNEKMWLTSLAREEWSGLQNAFYPNLNISNSVVDRIQRGDVKSALKKFYKDRTDANTKLWQALTSDSDAWQSEAEAALKLNPARETIRGDEKKVYTRLLYALVCEDKFEQAKWLIDNGADINALQRPFEDNDPEWPILYCAFRSTFFEKKPNKFKYYDFLIENGADVNVMVKNEELVDLPILRFMLSSDDLCCAEYLISKGADVNIAYGEPDNPLLYYALNGIKSDYYESHCGLLIKNGAQVNARTSQGHLMLTTLLMEENLAASQFLVKHGGRIDPEDLKLKTSSGKTVEELIKTSGIEQLKSLM